MGSSLAVRCALLGIVVAGASAATADTWRIHDRLRPKPAVIDPGSASTAERPGRPPSDAVVLFDGRDMAQWRALDGGPARWLVKDGALTTVKNAGPVRSLRAFGDCQLHIEWATPTPPEGSSQGRGNSGVILMGR